MPKTVDVQPELREFNKIFERISYRWDYAQVFHDFLTMAVIYFYPESESREERDRCMQRYDEKEKQMFNELFTCWITTFKDVMNTGDNKWWDFFGDYYETLASKGKRDGLGQFFTPNTIVEFMVQINGTDDSIESEETGIRKTGQKINDPACGSGRFLIAHHVHNLGNYYVAEDIDHVCCLMTCLNMMMHGCVGEVICHDALNPNDYRGGWHINPLLGKFQIPFIAPMERENSYGYKMWSNIAMEKAAEKKEKPKPLVQPILQEQPAGKMTAAQALQNFKAQQLKMEI